MGNENYRYHLKDYPFPGWQGLGFFFFRTDLEIFHQIILPATKIMSFEDAEAAGLVPVADKYLESCRGIIKLATDKGLFRHAG